MLEATQQERRYDPTKVAKCLSLSSRGWGDFCANHKYDTTQGENECAHIQTGSSVQARWLPPPWQTGCWVYSLPSQSC